MAEPDNVRSKSIFVDRTGTEEVRGPLPSTKLASLQRSS